MRVAVIIKPTGERVIAPGYRADYADSLIRDRMANGEAFKGETFCRLPRKVSREVLREGRLSFGFIGQAIQRTKGA